MDQYISRVEALAKKKGLAQKTISFFAPPRKMPKGLCPKNMVLLEIGVGSKLIRRCREFLHSDGEDTPGSDETFPEPTCPSSMRVVRGVCRATEKVIQGNPVRLSDTTSAKNLA
ncbi:hypothetical protein ANCDUO_02852 [Ancylostoma duodenale]|uniref:Uncharacterized protein n=1 Tax=Ancylostoma duodenale TaxID=51022 RepID=A0A0C2DAR0_9BILA|nr:hypothetical protein ANCDUO_02852 [Ancylostoma duodenale]